LNTVGMIHRHMNDHSSALESHRRALALAREIGNVNVEQDARVGLAETEAAQAMSTVAKDQVD